MLSSQLVNKYLLKLFQEMEKVAHTLAYDGTIMGNTQSGKPLESEVVARWTAVTMPTLVMSGGNSEAFFHDAAQTLVDILPDAKHHIIGGQDHALAKVDRLHE